MRDVRPRATANHGPRTATGVPDSQLQALDRRQALAEQQRAFRDPRARSHFGRPRPPA